MRNADVKKGVMGQLFQTGVLLVFLCLVMISSASAGTISTASLRKGYTAAELDQILAPVALYPDGLLLQVLMASTYPGDVVEAGRWLNANPDLNGEAAVEAAKDFEWNVSVKSLLAFPDMLLTMSSDMGWTVKLGNAFNTQSEALMERVQHLRRKARVAGNLQSDERMNVVTTGNNIAIEPASPEVIYVPHYNPTVVYGSWSWPGYAPYYWAPWRGYAYYPGYYSGGFMWGTGIWFSYTRFYGRVDWHRRHVHWNPPPKRPGPGYAMPGSKPHPGGSGHGGKNQARPDKRPGSASSNHVRPGYSSPGNNRPSGTVMTRPGREGVAHQGASRAKSAQRPGLIGSPSRPANNRFASAGQQLGSMSYSRPSASHPAVSSNHSGLSSSPDRPSDEERQAGSLARTPSRPVMSRSANVSRQTAPRSLSGMVFHGSGHSGRTRGGSPG